jgi:hypothetical protein
MDWETFWTWVIQILIMAVVITVLVTLGTSTVNTVMRKRDK